ncbi:Gibberellin-regulated protein 10 [Hibiscus syriacus]|uniref:Gibberellin-regulated protein 10 n=1 Tax=Hibiscus syriacus TaxID=106335 RepID=A0A6A2ZUD7_HIBSY|nr:peamaclein-like [Hibiscus syriacus]KAE8695027.1 Gibberellin-regulated protein 10 [Hibiscus syriacus]
MRFTMATWLFVSLVLISSFIQHSFAAAPASPPSPVPPSFCDSKCGERCGKAGMKDRCLKYCGICCQECKCVPSGTYGNKSECPCYRDKKNSKGNPKCP